jgi:hypothetical protein
MLMCLTPRFLSPVTDSKPDGENRGGGDLFALGRALCKA